MLRKLLIFFPWLYSQLISAQNQWIAALKHVNTAAASLWQEKFSHKRHKST